MAAEFTIDGTAFSTLGFDAAHDAVLDLALADTSGLDAARVVFSVVLDSADAAPLVFSPSTGIPTTPTGTVTVTMPSTGTHSWRIQCQVNEGYDANGRWDATLTRERIISIRSPNLGLRKLVPGETTQYDVKGWHEEQNRAVDLLDTYGLGSIAVVNEVTGAAPIVSSGGETPEISITAASGASAGSMSAAHYTLLANAAEASTASTLARRTSGGALRGDWFEADGAGTVATTGSVRLSSTGSIYAVKDSSDARVAEMFFGSLVLGSYNAPTSLISADHVMLHYGISEEPYARFLSSGTCTTVYDMRMGLGRPRVFVTDIGDTPLVTPYDAPMEAKHAKTAADSQGSDATTAFPISGPVPADALIVAAWYVPIDALTSNDSNYATLTVSAYSIGGALVGTVVQSTTITLLSGGTGSWVARRPISLAITSAAVASSQHLEFSISKSGTGVVVPAGLLVVRYILAQ